MAERPWHVEITLHIRGEGGYLDKDELELLDRLEDELGATLERRARSVHWGTFTHGKTRSFHLYTAVPEAAVELAQASVKTWGYEAQPRILWDPRLRAWRDYLEGAS